jgi:trehalose 6-phosphate synthase
VLILSRFAGAADDMAEALLVNPYDVDEIADAMHRALTMTLNERRERHRALRAAVWRTSAKHYCDTFMGYLADGRETRQDEPAFATVGAGGLAGFGPLP